MADIFEKVHAEMENISKVLSELEKVKDKPEKEVVVLAGIGSFLQNIYTGIENILKQLLQHIGIDIPPSPAWHKNLLDISVEHDFITKETQDRIGKYLYFRHFFTHAYGFMIEEKRLQPLVADIFSVYDEFKTEIENYLQKLKNSSVDRKTV